MRKSCRLCSRFTDRLKGLGNKRSKAVDTMRQSGNGNICPAGRRKEYGRNHAEHIHLPANREEPMFSGNVLYLIIFRIPDVQCACSKRKEEIKRISIYVFWGNGVGGRAPPICSDRGLQKKVIREVYADLSGGHIISRLIQATPVPEVRRLWRFWRCCRRRQMDIRGLMVPTEVLARQQYESMTDSVARNHIVSASDRFDDSEGKTSQKVD